MRASLKFRELVRNFIFSLGVKTQVANLFSASKKNSIVDKIKEIIKSVELGLTKKALSEIKSIVENDIELSKIITLNQSKFEQTKKDFYSGIISKEDYDIVLTRTNNAILEIVNEWKERPKEFKSKKKNDIFEIHQIETVSLNLIFSIITLGKSFELNGVPGKINGLNFQKSIVELVKNEGYNLPNKGVAFTLYNKTLDKEIVSELSLIENGVNNGDEIILYFEGLAG